MAVGKSGWVVVLGLVLVAGCGASDHAGGDPDAQHAHEADGDGVGSDGGPMDAAGSVGATGQVAADLVALREEEKLARDVYLTLYGVHGLTIHQNIASSEQSHTDAVKARLAAMGVADPVVDDTVGVFTDPDFRKLYVDLVESGSKSELDALIVGATVEDLDLLDIATMRTHSTDAAVVALYDTLACGSRNHLRSFVGQIASRKGTYQPQFISQAEFDAILAGSAESCGGGGGRRGGRRGGG